MLKVISKNVEARARNVDIARRVNVVQVDGLESPLAKPDPNNPQASEPSRDVHPLLWTGSGGMPPSEIRWIWNPLTGDMIIGDQGRHSGMTPSGTEWDSVLRGFYFPGTKTVAIRSYYWPQGNYDQWDKGHAELNANIQNAFIAAIQPTLKRDEPGINFETDINNAWLQQTTGRYSW